jgi:hypothetical protein
VKSDWINTKHDSKTGPFPSNECTRAGLGRAAAEGRSHCPAFPPPFPPFHSKSNTKNNKVAVARALNFPKNTPKGKGIMNGERPDHPKVSNDKTPAMHEDGVRFFLNGKFTGIITRWIDCTPDMRAGRGQKLHYYCTRYEYSSDRLGHAKSHYNCIHVKQGKPSLNKRKFAPTAEQGCFILKKQGASQERDRKRALPSSSPGASTTLTLRSEKKSSSIGKNVVFADAGVTDDGTPPALEEGSMHITEYDDQWSNPCVSTVLPC